MGDNAYFGMKLGEAISSGAGHISDAIRRRREIEAEAKERQERANMSLGLQMGSQGVVYDPENPAGSFDNYAAEMRKRREMEQGDANLNRQLLQRRIDTMGMDKGQSAPPGYRWKGENLEPIPGGPAFVKQEDIAQKKADAVATQRMRNEAVTSTVDEAIKKVGVLTSGFLGNIANKVGGTSAADLEGDLNTIKANLGFDRLSQMRAESPTGGALGQVSERELTLLTSAVAALDQKLSPTKLRENLLKIKTHLSNWENIIGQTKGAAPVEVPAVWDDSRERRYQELKAKMGGQ